MPATTRGIYHNLKESKYTVSNDDIVFYFSSKVYMQRFLIEHHSHRERMNKFKNKVLIDVNVNLDFIGDLKAYKEIEKRGFRCLMKGIEVNWQELEKYVYRQMTRKSTNDWYAIPAPKLIERLRTME